MKTHSELTARSDAITERESELAARDRVLAEQEAPPPALDELEARIRRLEQGGATGRTGSSTQTFSAGLQQLQQRSRRPPEDNGDALH